nr:uncharacterized protein LOC109164950 [Ipomoea batatas]GMC57752.1 uncharacterized protein LOC109164950 [Ipomoea batatas]GMC57753.1 uncharacterized protein LOC109164950 [Ipomoea batatas]GMD99046.1 uncharacterized protein LOC109164950 [Ipomoea batatas]
MDSKGGNPGTKQTNLKNSFNLGVRSLLAVCSNEAVCYYLMDFSRSFCNELSSPNVRLEEDLRVNVAEIICGLIKNLPPNSIGVSLMSMGVDILTKMLKW